MSFSFVITSPTVRSRRFSKRRSRLVRMPTSWPPRVTGRPEMRERCMMASASAIGCSGCTVTGSTIIPLSDFFTFSTSSACSATARLRWMTPRPPASHDRVRLGVRARRVRMIRSPHAGDLTLAEAAHEVVIDHADGLHVRVDDGGPHEPEATAFQVLAEGIGLVGLRRDVLDGSGAILSRPPVDEAPLIGGETPELVPHAQEGPGVLDRRFDLEPVANDARVAQVLLHFAGIEARDALGIEAGNYPPVRFRPPQELA